MSLIQFLRILIARKGMILATMLACLAVSTTVVLLLPKRYPGTARVLLDTMKPDPVTGQGMGAAGARTYFRTQTEFIKDLRVAAQVVDRLGLVNDPATIAAYEATGRSEADGGIRTWLAQQIIDRTQANQVQGSNILEITYAGRTPEEARQFAGLLRDAYVDASLRIRTDSASRTGDWFQEQAEKSRLELQAAEKALAEYMQEHSIVLQGGVDTETVKLQGLQAAVQAARGTQSSTEAMAAGRLANDPVADGIRAQIAMVEDELANASARLGPNHPTYKAIETRRNTLQRQLAAATSSSRAGVSAVAGAARSSLSQLEGQLAAQEQVVQRRRPIIDRLILLQREVDLKRAQYERSASRTADLQLEAASSETGLVLLGDATASTEPSYPRIPLVISLSAFFGFALGVLAAIVTEFVARRVRGAEDLSYATGVPVIVTVGGAEPSPLRQRLQRLFGRRGDDLGDGDLQAI